MMTWRWKSDLVTWAFTVPSHPNESAVACLQRSVVAVIRLLPPFARLESVEIKTEERGDGAFEFAGNNLEIAALRDALASPERTRLVVVTLDLAVRTDDAEQWLGGAATLFFDVDERRGAHGSAIGLSLVLDVDIYAPVSWGEERDNSELARVNGPRLTGFLTRLSEQLGVRLDRIDCGDYVGHVDANGFK
jgi:hypothetical protein